jgi:hypothetical protein
MSWRTLLVTPIMTKAMTESLNSDDLGRRPTPEGNVQAKSLNVGNWKPVKRADGYESKSP